MRAFFILVALLLTSCHCVRGPTERGVALTALKLSGYPRPTLMASFALYDPSIGVHGEVGRAAASPRHFTFSQEDSLALHSEVLVPGSDERWQAGSYLVGTADNLGLVAHETAAYNSNWGGAADLGDAYVSYFAGRLNFPDGSTLDLTDAFKAQPSGPQYSADMTPAMAVSFDQRWLVGAGVPSRSSTLAVFSVDLQGSPAVRRVSYVAIEGAETEPQHRGESIQVLSTFVRDSGAQLIALATGLDPKAEVPQWIPDQSETRLLVLAPDGSQSLLLTTKTPIAYVFSLDGHWGYQDDAGIHLVDQAGSERAFKTLPAARLDVMRSGCDYGNLCGTSKDGEPLARVVRATPNGLVLARADRVQLAEADEGVCGAGSAAEFTLALCVDDLNAQLEVQQSQCWQADRRLLQYAQLPQQTAASL